MSGATGARHIEARWPVVCAILALLVLLAELPDRIRLFPYWIPYVSAVALLTPMAALAVATARERWLAIERATTLIFCVLATGLSLETLVYLIEAMVRGSAELDGLQLLSTSIGVWVTNFIVFALTYWQIDRGGPGARETGKAAEPDWMFPHPATPSTWQPMFVDYLFLGYTTATAFSAADTLPLTPRAKLLMMVQSTISLVTIVVVAARAINILGS